MPGNHPLRLTASAQVVRAAVNVMEMDYLQSHWAEHDDKVNCTIGLTLISHLARLSRNLISQ